MRLQFALLLALATFYVGFVIGVWLPNRFRHRRVGSRMVIVLGPARPKPPRI